MSEADIGLVGLGVMGENLSLNLEGQGFTVACFNRTLSRVDDFINGGAKGKRIIGCHSLKELSRKLKRPRKLMFMVKAGSAVDELIGAVLPFLEKGDIIIDGGNSHFSETDRRAEYLEEKGLFYVGVGISGGAEGARKGPSIMPGGSPGARKQVQPIFRAIAARTSDGLPCCEWIGPGGSGHYVKMVHNGIEYADMQMIGEAYFLMKAALEMGAGEISKIFRKWNEGELNSYLIEITGEILARKDEETGEPLIDLILDAAGDKGTGRWAVRSALDLGSPAVTIAAATLARFISALKEERSSAAKQLSGPEAKFKGDRAEFIEDIRHSLYAGKICSYAQGFQLLRRAAANFGWKLNYGEIARIWRGGCIIRARLLEKIQEAWAADAELANLLLDPYFRAEITARQPSWRKVVTTAVNLGIPAPALSSALIYFDSYRSGNSPAALLQAQRDYFGAHRFERVDGPRGRFFHFKWK